MNEDEPLAEGPIKDAPGSTEQKGAIAAGKAAVEQNELSRSEERYHRMIAEVEDYAILMLDAGGIVQNWNIGAEKIKGYKEEEIVGQHFRIFYTPDDREAQLPERLIEEAATKGKANHEGWRRRKDGTLFWGNIVITALHDERGGVIGFSKVTRDLTARRLAEEKLKRYSEDLEFQNRELQQFAYAAAHDMKEPLRKMSFYNSFLLETLKGKLSEKEEKYLRRSMEAAIRMQQLIDDLLTYSRASAAGGSFEEIDLLTVIAEAGLTYQDSIEETGARIETGNLPKIWGVAFQLRQLFENLLSNALKYRDPVRNPVIQIKGEHGWFSPNGEGSKKEYAKITVADNGIGFESEKAQKIFDIFQRLDNQRNLPGTGIGLAISKRIAQNHRGTILAKGIPGVGAEFTIYLPVKPPAAAPAAGILF